MHGKERNHEKNSISANHLSGLMKHREGFLPSEEDANKDPTLVARKRKDTLKKRAPRKKSRRSPKRAHGGVGLKTTNGKMP